MTNPAMIGIIAAVVFMTIALVLLILILVKQSRQLRLLEEQSQTAAALDDLSRFLQGEWAHMGSDLQLSVDRSGERLLSALGQVTQAQTALMENVQRQMIHAAQQQEEQARKSMQTVVQQLSQVEVRMENLRRACEQQLTQVRQTVDEKLTQSLDKRLNESFALVSGRLEKVYQTIGEMQSIAEGVVDLKKILGNVKTRGIWGEMQLSALLKQMLTQGQYAENVAVVPGATERVEFALILPGQEGDSVYLPIDSKFPQEDYLRLVEAQNSDDAATAEEARKALYTRIRTEAKRIAGKYIAPPHTTDFAVMFLPVEGLYAAVVQQPGLVEELQASYRVVIAGPSTFSALLSSLQMGFRTLAIEKRTSEVWKLLGAIRKDFGQFTEVLRKTQQKLQQATDSIDTAFVRTRAIERKLSQVEIGEGDGEISDGGVGNME